ncbi:hypothetical protein [Cellulomonas soli]
MTERTSWADVRAADPAFAEAVAALFDAGTNKVLATLRADGSPGCPARSWSSTSSR